ncbi:MAG: dienelactone hydrolase family protein, partial [Propionibacteriaceae bacterium]
MKTTERRVTIPGAGVEIQAVVVEPVGPPARCGVVYYTDIFQITESTLRTARRLAAEGFVVYLPEIYPRELAGVALEFDDAGKAAGLAGAAHTSTAEFDADRAAVLAHLAD